MKSLWRHLGNLFFRQLRSDGAANAAVMFAGAVRAMLFPREHLELLRLEIFHRYVVVRDDPNPIFHLSHRYYLCRSFSRRDRIASALSHYRFEDDRYDDAYKQAVYRDGGIDLWSRCVDGGCYRLRLRATTDLRHEGGLSVVLCADADDVVLCEMSYAWVEPERLGLGGQGTLPFITRNQSIRRDAAALIRFREAFPQNSPAYFCLAAVHGIVQAHGIDRVAGIRHELQVAYEERYARNFLNSYCEFWKSFGAREASGVAHLMPVPLAAPPLAGIPAKHRRRALERRRHWGEIAREAREAIAPRLRRDDGQAGATAVVAAAEGPLTTFALTM